MSEANIVVPVDLTNPGHFFACCGLLEVTNRFWPGAEGWFQRDAFAMRTDAASLSAVVGALQACTLSNTMTSEQTARLEALSAMSKKQRSAEPHLEDEKKSLDALRRDLPIVLGGAVSLVIDWFVDDLSGGSRFKTWAGQQSVLEIATAMHRGVCQTTDDLWTSIRGIGLPFNFDSDLGGQGSPLDIGFSFDPLAGSETTRIEGTCRPAIELLGFIGLQRFRPRGTPGENRFVYRAWSTPLSPSVAAPVVAGIVNAGDAPRFDFRLLYRTKYLKSFLPAIPFQGDGDE